MVHHIPGSALRLNHQLLLLETKFLQTTWEANLLRQFDRDKAKAMYLKWRYAFALSKSLSSASRGNT